MNTRLTPPTLLTHKHAVIFCAGGTVGTAVAKEFAAQGATVHTDSHDIGAHPQS